MNHGLRSHGQVLALLFDSSMPGRIWSGLNAEQSLFFSDDAGENWLPLAADSSSPDGPWPPPTYALLQPARSPRVILAATGGGLYRSPDSGQNWHSVESLPASEAVFALAGDSLGGLYLGGEGSTGYHSTDGGLSWRGLSPVPEGGAVLSLAVSPAGDWLLAGTDGAGLFSSRDQGESWQRVDAIGPQFVSSVLLQPAGVPPCPPEGDCALVRTRSGLFITQDGGSIWRKLEGGWNGRVDATSVAGAEPQWVLATDRGRIYRSLDGRRWEPWGDGLGRTGAVFSLASDPDHPANVVAGTENGLYVSSDGGLHWQQPADGPGAPSADALALGPRGLLYLANRDGVYLSTDEGETWDRRSQGLPLVPILALAVAPSAPNRVYAGASGAGLWRSDDGGGSWSVTEWDGATVPGIVVHPQAPDRLYFRVAFERVYSSDDGGESVQARWNGFTPFTETISLVMDGHNPDRLYAGGTDRLYRTLDGARSWQPIGAQLDGQTVYALEIDDGGRGRLFAGATKGVYISLDDGLKWDHWGAGLEDITVTALARHPTAPEQIYAGTRYQGVYRSADAGRTWQPAGLSRLSVNALHVSEDGRWVYAATPQGFFRAEAQ